MQNPQTMNYKYSFTDDTTYVHLSPRGFNFYVYHMHPSNAHASFQCPCIYLQHPEVGTHWLQSVPVHPELHLHVKQNCRVSDWIQLIKLLIQKTPMEETHKHWLGVLQYPPTEWQPLVQIAIARGRTSVLSKTLILDNMQIIVHA